MVVAWKERTKRVLLQTSLTWNDDVAETSDFYRSKIERRLATDYFWIYRKLLINVMTIFQPYRDRTLSQFAPSPVRLISLAQTLYDVCPHPRAQ